MPPPAHQFCTIVDEGLVLRGLGLYRSLAKVAPESHLYVACSDEVSKGLLDALRLPGLTTISFAEVERWDPSLLGVKPKRSRAEYAQTAKASVCLYVLELAPESDHVAFLDADLFFLGSLVPIFEELVGNSILIVPHRREGAPEWTDLYGTYNSGTVVFRRDDAGLEALHWWRARCIEWCYLTPEDGKYTDQRYLNDWPERFRGVRVLEHLGGGLAPWNGSQYSFSRDLGRLLVEGQPVIFYHLQSLQLYRGITTIRRLGFLSDIYRLTLRPTPLLWRYLDVYPVSSEEDRLFWQPYAGRLSEALRELRRVDPAFEGGFKDGRADARARLEPRIRKKVRRTMRPYRRALKRAQGSRRRATKEVRGRLRDGKRTISQTGGRLLRRCSRRQRG